MHQVFRFQIDISRYKTAGENIPQQNAQQFSLYVLQIASPHHTVMSLSSKKYLSQQQTEKDADSRLAYPRPL